MSEARRKAFHAELAAPPPIGGQADPRDQWHPLTFRERLRLAPGVSDVWFVLGYFTGLRDRMRCPHCSAVGTFKMHGTLLERWLWGDLPLRRWGCKWCGYWITKDGRTQAYPSKSAGVWAFPGHDERGPTPAETVFEHMGKTWPWLG